MSRVEFSSSRLDVGSSARMIFGLLARALVTAMRCLSPPLRVSVGELMSLAIDAVMATRRVNVIVDELFLFPEGHLKS